MSKLIVTMDDIKRYKVLTEVIEKRLSLKNAVELLSVSYRHAIRIEQKIKDDGLEGILRKAPPSPPNKKIASEITDTILTLRKELYYDFNIMHFKDKLEEVHNIHLSYESLRQLLIQHNIHSPRKKKIVHRQRRRMPKAGMLVQMDSSEHRWLQHISEKWWLIAMIDYATNEVFYAGLIKEIRLAGIKDYDEANMYLVEKFLPYYNARFTHEAESAYMPLPKDTDLDLIFCIKRQRTVNKDNTISFNGQVIQIPPSDIKLSFAKNVKLKQMKKQNWM